MFLFVFYDIKNVRRRMYGKHSFKQFLVLSLEFGFSIWPDIFVVLARKSCDVFVFTLCRFLAKSAIVIKGRDDEVRWR